MTSPFRKTKRSTCVDRLFYCLLLARPRTPRIYRLRLDHSVCTPGYLLSFLTHPATKPYIESFNSGGSRRAITKGNIESFEIPLPPLSEQEAIANILSTLDDKIEFNRRMNRTLEAMAQTIFKSWFVDFDPVKAKQVAKTLSRAPERAAMAALSGKLSIPKNLADLSVENLVKAEVELDQLGEEERKQLAQTAALFPDGFVESELGLIPEGWDTGKLGDIVELIGGGTPKKSEKTYWHGTIPWFSVKDAPNGSDVFVLDTEEKITELGLHNSSTRLLPVGTTIISARGTVGRLALVGVSMAMNQSCYGVVGAKGFPPFFNYFNLCRSVDVLKRNTHGAVFDTITRATFESVARVIPSDKVIYKFEQAVSRICGRIENNCRQVRILANLRDLILPKLLSGELRVDDVEDALRTNV